MHRLPEIQTKPSTVSPMVFDYEEGEVVVVVVAFLWVGQGATRR